jgi:hypothetical protein
MGDYDSCLISIHGLNYCCVEAKKKNTKKNSRVFLFCKQNVVFISKLLCLLVLLIMCGGSKHAFLYENKLHSLLCPQCGEVRPVVLQPSSSSAAAVTTVSTSSTSSSYTNPRSHPTTKAAACSLVNGRGSEFGLSVPVPSGYNSAKQTRPERTTAANVPMDIHDRHKDYEKHSTNYHQSVLNALTADLDDVCEEEEEPSWHSISNCAGHGYELRTPPSDSEPVLDPNLDPDVAKIVRHCRSKKEKFRPLNDSSDSGHRRSRRMLTQLRQLGKHIVANNAKANVQRMLTRQTSASSPTTTTDSSCVGDASELNHSQMEVTNCREHNVSPDKFRQCCPMCRDNQVFTRPELWAEHISQCQSICNFTNPNLETMFKEGGDYKNEGPHVCLQCNQDFGTKYALKSHFKENPYHSNAFCYGCNAGYESAVSVRRHCAGYNRVLGGVKKYTPGHEFYYVRKQIGQTAYYELRMYDLPNAEMVQDYKESQLE